jgi:hypothetical protein
MSEMKTSGARERPILFSAPMVRAILDGRKTQTRRVVKPQPASEPDLWFIDASGAFAARTAGDEWLTVRCPYGLASDRLWVRETWRLHERFSDVARIVYAASQGRSWTEMHEDFPAEKAGRLAPSQKFKPSIHMPRWASRITLEITDVRVERLNDCSSEDAKAEGLEWAAPTYGISGVAESWNADPVAAYRALWEHINGPDAWAANPWVWVVSFKQASA